MKTPALRARETGLSLIEFMVAMLLGTILIAGAVTIYLASQRSYLETERAMGIGDSGRFALMVMNESLRHAGFFGGMQIGELDRDGGLANPADDCTGEGAAYNTDNFIFARAATGGPLTLTKSQNNDTGSAFGCIDDEALAGSDVLVVRYLRSNAIYDADPTDPQAPRDGTLSWPNPPGEMDDETTYVLTNGVVGTLLAGGGTEPSVDDGEAYPGAVAWPYQFQIFYVRVDGDNRFLSRKTLRWDSGAMSVQTDDLVEGVEVVRYRFGYDTDNDGLVDTFGNHEDVEAAGAWDQVASVEAFILVRSPDEDPNYVNEKTYTVGDYAPITPNDGYVRLLVNSSITLRNPNIFMLNGP